MRPKDFRVDDVVMIEAHVTMVRDDWISFVTSGGHSGGTLPGNVKSIVRRNFRPGDKVRRIAFGVRGTVIAADLGEVWVRGDGGESYLEDARQFEPEGE